jgi:conjugal transfer pilus assembly protein TraW
MLSMTTTALRLLSIAVALAATQVHARDLGTVGAVYPIAEPDSLAELKARVARVDWKKHLDRDRLAARVRDFRPRGLKRLPPATRDRSFLSDLTYTLERDIPDGRGGILYPRGYRFNPLDYVRLRRTVIVIDGSDRRQVAWFRKSPWKRDINALLLLTGGNYAPLGDSLGRPVFYADQLIVERFGLRAVPSVACQNGRFVEVREYAVR